MHLSMLESYPATLSEAASRRQRFVALLRDRHAAPEAGASDAAVGSAAARRASYLTAASIAAGLIAAWAGLCVI